MATSQSDWEVEHVGNDEQVKLELRDGERNHMRLTRNGKTVELHVDDDAVGEVIGREEVPEWVRNVAARLGVSEVH